VKSKLCALILAAIAATALLLGRTGAQTAARPLHQEQLLKLIQQYVPSARLADLVRQRGIDFEPTQQFLAILRKAGAEPLLLDTLREARVIRPNVAREPSGRALAGPQGGSAAQAGSPPPPARYSDVPLAGPETVRPADESDASRTHLVAGQKLLAQNRLDEAVAEIRQAVLLQPDSAETHRALSAALFEKGDLDGAIAEYRQALHLGPDGAGAHINLGLALYVNDDLDGALAEYREAVRLSPSDPANHFMLGNALVKKLELETAIAEFREAVRLQPKFAAAHDALGAALERKNDLHSALEQYRIAHNLQPAHPDYRFHYEHLSEALARSGKR
jgi:Flp pilus assembly protein TadD